MTFDNNAHEQAMTVISKQVDRLNRSYNAACVATRTEKQYYIKAKQHFKHTQEAIILAQDIAQQIQQTAHAKVGGVVTHCLQSVFGDAYEFRIKFEKTRDKTNARLLLLKDGNVVENPVDEDSGGVVDVASFALRLACLMLSKPQLARVLFLDEPFRFVSRGYRDNVKQMLLQLAEDLQLQMVMVTHIEELKVGKVVQL